MKVNMVEPKQKGKKRKILMKVQTISLQRNSEEIIEVWQERAQGC